MSVAEISATMSAVILLVFLLFAIFGSKIKAKSRYIILCIVLLRLAIPLGIPGVPSLFKVEFFATPSIAEQHQNNSITPIVPDAAVNDFKDYSFNNTINKDYHISTEPKNDFSPITGTLVESKPEPFYERMAGEDWFNLFLNVYIFGASVFLFLSLLSHVIFIIRIKRGRTLGEEHVYSIYADVCRENGITDPPLIWESTATDSPMIIGLLIPRVILPSGLDENALGGMLAHELKHFTRRDLWIKFLCLAAKSIHWFNPLVHIACARCVQEMELSCDEEVLQNCDIEKRREYGTAMLNVIRNCRRQGAALTTHFSPNKKSVKARFVGIMDTEKKKRGVGIIVLSVILCLISGILISCSLSISINDFSNEDETTVAETSGEITTPITTDEPETTSVVTTTEDVVTTVPQTTETVVQTTRETSVSATKKPYTPPEPSTPSVVDMFDSGLFNVTEFRTADDSVIYWDVKMYNGQTITYVLDEDVSYCPSAKEIASLVDVNFDGHSDLLICKGGYGVQGAISYHCYLYSDESFILCPSFSSIPNPVVDSEKRLIKGTYRENASKSVTEYYTFSGGVFNLVNRDDGDTSFFYFNDFSDESALDDFKVFRGVWAVRNGRLWLDAVDAIDYSLAESSGFILYKGHGWESLTNYQVDVDIYDIQTQTGILSRCDLNKADPSSSNAFYGYFSFVSKTGRRGAHGYGNPYGNWGSNLIVSNNYFSYGADLHLTLTVIDNELRCVFTDIATGKVLLDLLCDGGSCWSHGTFGLRMLNQYLDGPTSLGVTSFDNLRVIKIS